MINVDYARARRQEIIERQTELSEKPRMSEADHRAFRKLQDEFERLTLDINKARQEERDAGVWTGVPIHDDAPTPARPAGSTCTPSPGRGSRRSPSGCVR